MSFATIGTMAGRSNVAMAISLGAIGLVTEAGDSRRDRRGDRLVM
jgi:hypothetical protein